MTDQSKVKILIVEDEMIIAADLSMQLTKLGYSIIGIMTRGEDVLPSLSINPPDIVLMDIVLNGKMNGIEAAIQIKDSHKIPVIFLTSNADDATFQKAKEAKPYAFITKPFKRDDLIRAIELTLERIDMEQKPDQTENDQVSKLEDRLFIRHKNEMIMIPLDDIILLEADRNYCKLFTTKKDYLLTVPLNKVEIQVPDDVFIRTHRSFVVNLKHITSISEFYEYLMIGEKMVPISRRMKDGVVKRFKLI